MAAIQSVFATEELLELIFLNSDIRTIITSIQRVCKKWHTAISTSVAVQRHLYFAPAPLPNASGTIYRHLNPLLSELFQPWFQHVRDPETWFNRDAVDRNLDWQSVEEWNHSNQPSNWHKFDNSMRNFSSTTLFACGEDPDSPWRRAGATWKNMLVAQPPVTKIGIYQCPNQELEMITGRRWEVISSSNIDDVAQVSPDAAGGNKRILMSPFGPRMGELYDETLRRVRWRGPGGFEIFHGVQEVAQEEFERRVGEMNFDSYGEQSRMYEAGAELVLLVFPAIHGSGSVDEMLRVPFWRRCCGMDDPGLEAEEQRLVASLNTFFQEMAQCQGTARS